MFHIRGETAIRSIEAYLGTLPAQVGTVTIGTVRSPEGLRVDRMPMPIQVQAVSVTQIRGQNQKRRILRLIESASNQISLILDKKVQNEREGLEKVRRLLELCRSEIEAHDDFTHFVSS